MFFFFFFSSRRRHTRFKCDWSSDVCSSDLRVLVTDEEKKGGERWHCDDRPEPSRPRATGWNEVLFPYLFRLLPADLPARVHKGNSRLQIQCTLAAIEIVLLILVPLRRGKLT